MRESGDDLPFWRFLRNVFPTPSKIILWQNRETRPDCGSICCAGGLLVSKKLTLNCFFVRSNRHCKKCFSTKKKTAYGRSTVKLLLTLHFIMDCSPYLSERAVGTRVERTWRTLTRHGDCRVGSLGWVRYDWYKHWAIRDYP